MGNKYNVYITAKLQLTIEAKDEESANDIARKTVLGAIYGWNAGESDEKIEVDEVADIFTEEIGNE